MSANNCVDLTWNDPCDFYQPFLSAIHICKILNTAPYSDSVKSNGSDIIVQYIVSDQDFTN